MSANQAGLSSKGTTLLKWAAVWLLAGLVLGIAMAASHQFQLRPVHTHINLLGWASMALTGIVYCLFPAVAASRLATGHVWLHTLGLPVMMAGLAAYSLGELRFEPVIAAGSVLVTAGLALFAVSLFLNIAPRSARAGMKVSGSGTASVS